MLWGEHMKFVSHSEFCTIYPVQSKAGIWGLRDWPLRMQYIHPWAKAPECWSWTPLPSTTCFWIAWLWTALWELHASLKHSCELPPCSCQKCRVAFPLHQWDTSQTYYYHTSKTTTLKFVPSQLSDSSCNEETVMKWLFELVEAWPMKPNSPPIHLIPLR